MTKNLLKKTILLVILFPLGVFAQTFFPPTVLPPNGNITSPFDVSSVAQSKIAGLILNSDASAIYGLSIPFGKVGIGTLTPGGLFDVFDGVSTVFTVLATGEVGVGVANSTSKFSVSGGVQIGDDATCDTPSDPGSKSGTLRWSSGVVDVCNGITWASISSATSLPSCIASGGCPTSIHGTLCNSYTISSGTTCPGPVESTCSYGTWTPAPEQYNSCSPYVGCNAIGACPATASGGICSWNTTPSSDTACPANTVSTCTNGIWSPGVPFGTYTQCVKRCPGLNGCFFGYEGDTCVTNDIDRSTSCPPNTTSTCTNYVWTPTPKAKGACLYPIYGCMDSSADNYDPNANVDQSCDYTNAMNACLSSSGSWESNSCVY